MTVTPAARSGRISLWRNCRIGWSTALLLLLGPVSEPAVAQEIHVNCTSGAAQTTATSEDYSKQIEQLMDDHRMTPYDRLFGFPNQDYWAAYALKVEIAMGLVNEDDFTTCGLDEYQLAHWRYASQVTDGFVANGMASRVDDVITSQMSKITSTSEARVILCDIALLDDALSGLCRTQ